MLSLACVDKSLNIIKVITNVMIMKHNAKLIRVGNSTGVTIPHVLLKQIQAQEGDLIAIEFQKKSEVSA